MTPQNFTILQTWLKHASKDLDFNFNFNEEQQCIFEIDETLVCILEPVPETEGILMYSPVADLTENTILSTQLVLKALSLNLFQGSTNGGVLGLSPNQDQIIYSVFETIDALEEATFFGLLSIFVQTATDLHASLQPNFGAQTAIE